MQHFCVGENTKSILIKNGQKVLKMANNSIKLANFLKKMNKKKHLCALFDLDGVIVDNKKFLLPRIIFAIKEKNVNFLNMIYPILDN